MLNKQNKARYFPMDIVFKLQPLEFIPVVLVFYTLGKIMHTGKEIEQFRLKYGFTILCIRTTLDMTEAEYQRFIHGRYTPAAYQLIGFLIAFRCPLNSIIEKIFQEGYPIPPYKRT